MKETLQAAMLSLINSTVDTVQDGVAFLKQEIPDVITQLLTWHMVESFIYFGSFLIIALTFFVVVKYLCVPVTVKRSSYHRNTIDEEIVMARWKSISTDGSGGILVAIAWIGVISSLLLSLTQLVWIKILIAPKLYLLEYAATLIK